MKSEFRTLARIGAIASIFLLPAAASAQIPTYTTPQTVIQALATNTACTGSNQVFPVSNLGQNQHSATVNVSGTTTTLLMFIQGQDSAGTVFPISDTVFSVHTSASTPAVTASGSYPVINVVVRCSGGTFTLNYSGTSSQSNVPTGAYLSGAIDKAIYQGAVQGTSTTGAIFVPPFGSSAGVLVFQYQTAAVSGSSIQVNCLPNATVGTYVSYIFNLSNVTTIQTFPVPTTMCPNIQVSYNSGGASANTYSLDYLLNPTGNPASSTAANLSATLNLSPILSEKGSRWDVLSAPAAGTVGSASKAAGTAGVRHVADCVSFSAGAIAAPAATALQVNLRDGATGAGTVIWTQTVTIPATAAPHYSQNFCGLNLIGTAATAMTLEFSAALASESESVTLTGYDVQ